MEDVKLTYKPEVTVMVKVENLMSRLEGGIGQRERGKRHGTKLNASVVYNKPEMQCTFPGQEMMRWSARAAVPRGIG